MLDAWKERQRKRLENRPERTVFYNIFSTMMLVLTVEVLLAVVSIFATNVTGQLDENAKDLLTMRVRNRASYVQDLLLNAEDLEQLSEQINATTQQMLKSGAISLDTLDNSSEQSDALLVALAPQLLDTLRAKQVTGIFIMLNTHDLDTCEVDKKMPGIYLRDLDPDARPSERNSDLLLERASATVVKNWALARTRAGSPLFLIRQIQRAASCARYFRPRIRAVLRFLRRTMAAGPPTPIAWLGTTGTPLPTRSR